jgi:hypothetical protein
MDDYDTECIAHLDAEGLRYYLPALLLSVIDDVASGPAATELGQT